MEALGGGGHLTNAATQLKGVTVEEAIAQLQQAITEQLSRVKMHESNFYTRC